MKIVVKYIKDIEKKIGTQNTYIQIKRGLFKTNSGKIINADVNGSINILRKYIKEVFSKTRNKGENFNFHICSKSIII